MYLTNKMRLQRGKKWVNTENTLILIEIYVYYDCADRESKKKKSPRKKQHYTGKLNRERWKENEEKKANIQNKE